MLNDIETAKLTCRLTEGRFKLKHGVQKATLQATPDGYTVRLHFSHASLTEILNAVYAVSGRAVMEVPNVVGAEDGLPVVTFGPIGAAQLRRVL